MNVESYCTLAYKSSSVSAKRDRAPFIRSAKRDRYSSSERELVPGQVYSMTSERATLRKSSLIA